jgi:hypothetical protein
MVASYIRDLFGGTLGLGAGPTTGTNFANNLIKEAVLVLQT